jgi:glyoxylase-like metal-dependent hydrolase (beta-lactamase superfamily II)
MQEPLSMRNINTDIPTRIELPLPWELGKINVYRLGPLLVDCGLNTPEALAAVEPYLDGVEWIVLTHTHPDHVGQAPELLRRTGAKLAMHRKEFEQIEGWIDANEAGREYDDGLQVAGTPPELIPRIDSAFRNVRSAMPRLKPDRFLDDGDRIGDEEVLFTPGHSPGHICLLAGRNLLSGDHLLETITPNIGWIPGEDALGQFLNSLDRVGELDIERVYPAHGNPFEGHRAWIAETHAHHEARCHEIEVALRLHPRSAHELVPVLWPRHLSAFHYRFAVYEVLAHLEYLRRRGRVVQVQAAIWEAR